MTQPIDFWKGMCYGGEDDFPPNAVECVGEIEFHYNVIGWRVCDEPPCGMDRRLASTGNADAELEG